MNYWIFKANPEKYDIDRRLQNPDPYATWLVTRYRQEISLDDIAYIWRAGNPRGIVAVMLIQSDPIWGLPSEAGWIEPEPFNWRVKGIFVHRFPIILSSDLRMLPGLEKLSVFHGYQAVTNFRVTPAEGRTIAREIYRRNSGFERVIPTT